MGKTKTIELINFSNEELKKIVKLNCYDADTIKILYRKISVEEIKEKIISMSNVLIKLVTYIYNDVDIDKNSIKTEDEKFWINVEYEGNEVSSISINTDEVIDVIKLLNTMFEYIEESDAENSLIDLVQSKIDESYMFRKHYGKGRAYFNYDLTIITENVDTKVIKEYPVVTKEGDE